MLQLINVKKDYKTAGASVHALKGVNLRFRKNEFVSILGPSGCGKTTMLNIIGGLDHYTSGDLVINGKSTKTYKDREWDVYRNHRIGFVFQSYNLIPQQTVLGNVEIALTIAGVSKEERKRRAAEALKRVGLEKEMKKRPNQLSGGQMQRVAIARALVNNPEILLADEPTGALDTETSVQIMDLIREIAGERLVVMVTHNPELAEEYSSRIVRLQDGLVVADSNPYDGEEATLIETPKEEEEPVDYGARIAQAAVEAVQTGGKLTNERVAQAIAKKEEKPRDLQTPVPQTSKKSKRKERASMSFKTSLGLSAGNLAMKKGRTIITSIAGSIGIISVCLVLALSNGFNGYITKTQEDMLSSSPLQIKETTVDVNAIMSGMQGANDMPDMSKIDDQVYVNSFLTGIAHGMTVKNNLSDEYLEYLNSMDEEWYEAISYNRGETLDYNLFTEVEIEDESGNNVQTVMSLAELKSYYTLKLTQQEEKYASLAYLVDYLGSVYGRMPGTAAVNREKGNFMDYVKSQYALIGEGSFPTKSNEAVLVVGGNNDMIDLTLAQLGFIGEKEFLELFPKEGESADSVEDAFIPFSKIVGKQFMLNYNDAVFTPAEATAEYAYTYTGKRDALDTDESKGTAVTITAVVRLKEGLNYGCLGNGGLFLTEELFEKHLEVNQDSKLAQTLRMQANTTQECSVILQEMKGLSPDSAAYTEAVERLKLAFLMGQANAAFKVAAPMFVEYYMPVSSVGEASQAIMTYLKDCKFLFGDTALRLIGGKDSVNVISIYTSTFETKEYILNHLDAWNDDPNRPTEDRVQYTDTVGMMMSMVEMMLNAITYVLVAFTAISLIVSSVMIGIITYVSVVERVKEIGVLRSLGARTRDIKNLFNAETFIIGLSSGVFGVLVTYAASIGINALLGKLTGIATLAALPLSSAIIMIVISVALTLISGLIPARAAAKKDPVVALRTE